MKKIFLFKSIILLAFSSSIFAQSSPTNLTTTNITTNTADVSWVDNGCAPLSGDFSLRYRIAGTAWSSGTSVLTTAPSTSATLTSLTINTDYEWRVKCDGCSGPGCWSPTVQFSTSTPTIDSAFISQEILCFGGFATDSMQINVSQTTLPTTYTCAIGYYASATFFVSFYSSSQTDGTQLNFNGFSPNQDYVVRIVDSTAYYSANTFGNGTSTVGIYDEWAVPINFSEPAQLVVTTTELDSNLCFGDCIAQEEIVISGGTQPYNYILNSNPTVFLGPQSHTINTLGNTFTPDSLNINIGDTVTWNNTGGSHNVNATQATFPNNPAGFGNGVSASAWSFQWIFTVAGSYDYQCDPHVGMGMTGVVIVNSNPVNTSTDTFINLCEGVYDLVVSDANGCATDPPTTTITIDTILPISPASTVTLFNLNGYNISCFGASDGQIFAFSSGGTAPFSYSIDSVNFQSSTSFSGLTEGTYTITHKDANGCIEYEILTLDAPPALSATASITQAVDCYGGMGEITIDVDLAQPGIPSYQYSIDNTNFQTSNTFDLLLGNINYDVMIEDDNGCQFTVPVYLSEPTQLTVDPTTKIDITCNGINDGIATVINPGGGTPFTSGDPYTYSWDDSLGQSMPNADNLSAGTYTCTITDSTGCFLLAPSVTIENPTLITAGYLTTAVSCFDGANGDASVIPSGGTPFTSGAPYTYLWNDALSQTTLNADALSAGTYTCTITDSTGCSFTTSLISITQSSQIVVTSSKTNVTCYGLVDGTATVSPSGGIPFTSGASYTYLWDDVLSQTIPNPVNLSAGTYICTITDSLDCDIFYSVIITEPSLISSSVTTTNILCNGLSNGTATLVNLIGGTPFAVGLSYTYLWDDALAQITLSADSLSSGTYTCTITDSTGCSFTSGSVIITEPDLLQIDSTHYLNVSCHDADDAEILSIDVLGGVSPFEYSVNGSTHYSNMAYFNSYGSGVYTVEVYDSNNCVAADEITITKPDELVVDILTSGWVFNNNSGLYSYQIKCNGDNSGFANLAINGGTPPYTKNLYDATTGILITSNSSNSFIDLTAGEYNFEVIDDNGCTYTETVMYSEPAPITHSFIATHVSCSEWSNGSLTDIVSGGVGSASSYIYSWNTGDSSYTIDAIPVGTYTITVKDENNCLSDASYVINDNNALIVTSLAQSISCYDYCDGEIYTTVSGGIPNYDVNGNSIYSYQWDDILLQTTNNAIGLCADNNSNLAEYSCIVTDAQGCSDTVYSVLNQPDSLYVSASITSNYNLQDISCYGSSDGKLKASSIGGNAPYNFTWSTGFSQNNTNISNISNLLAGIYTVVVEDSKGCMDTTEIVLNEPTELNLSISQTNVNCFEIFDGTIKADADGGTPFPGIPSEYNYSFSSGFNEQVDISFYLDVVPGIYTVTATDNNGCSVISESIFISQPTDLLTIDLDSIDESCNEDNGVVNSFVFGGTLPYTYLWSNGVNGSNASIVDLSPGIYFVHVVDKNGCIINDTIRVNGSSEVFLPGNISSFDTTICLGSNFDLNIEEKLGFTYIWENNNEILLNKLINNLTNDHADITVTPLDYVSVYTLNIINPSCSSSYDVVATFNVEFIDPFPASNPGVKYGSHPIVLAGDNLDLYAENNTCVEYTWQWTSDTISNNSGSITVSDLQTSDWYYLYVRDSEGCLGFDSIYVVVGVTPYEAITPNNDGFNDTWSPLDIESYDNSFIQVFNRWGGLVFESIGGEGYQPWDGTNNGKELAVGTYYYIIDLNTDDEPQTGPITIIR